MQVPGVHAKLTSSHLPPLRWLLVELVPSLAERAYVKSESVRKTNCLRLLAGL